MNDKYNQTITKIVTGKMTVGEAWCCGGSPLFAYCNRTGRLGNFQFGCPIQVHNPHTHIVTEDVNLTIRIKNDSRIHSLCQELEADLSGKTEEEKRAILEPYAEYQREMDKLWPERNV